MQLDLGLQLGKRRGGLPRTGLVFLSRDGLTDTIGLSSAALWAALPATHRSIYFTDPDDEETMLDNATIITNIEASPYYNNGEELVGNATQKAQYKDGTSEAVLRKAYRYFGVAYPENTYWQRVDGSNILRTDGTPIEVFG